MKHPTKPWEEAIAEATGVTATVVRQTAVSGGCINDSQCLLMSDGSSYFVKTHPNPAPHWFTSEAEGLEAMRMTGTLRVPEVVAVGDSPQPFLILEWIKSAAQGSESAYEEALGRGLAQMHQSPAGHQFGFHQDNFIGATEQHNSWCDDWNAFWGEHRLAFQLAEAERRGRGNAELQQLGHRLIERLDEILGPCTEPAALLHGDLWSGNHCPDENGLPVLLDPACYYGHREAEFGMMVWFGGFSDRLYAAYDEVAPLSSGSEDRIAVYQLYHTLNHLNLFGNTYLADCLRILRRCAG